jgi:hypothetical protein
MIALPALLWRTVLNMLRYLNTVIGPLSAYKLKQSLIFIGQTMTHDGLAESHSV